MRVKGNLAYIMSRFPGLSETFILREICELEKLDWRLELYPLLFQQETVVHAEALNWIGRVRHSGVVPVVTANIFLFVSRPLFYISLLVKVISGNIRSIKFLLRAVVVFPVAIWMARSMRNDKIEHVHAHYATHPAMAAWIIHQVTGISYSVTVHAHDIFADKCMLEQKLRNAQKIVAISQYNREYLIKYLGEWINEKIEVVHCGVYPELYGLKTYSASLERQPFEILSIGSLRPYKGFMYLVDACDILHRSGVTFHCRIVGGGELYKALLGRIQNMNLQDHVELIGSKTQAEVADLLRQADCYVQPSVITSTGKMEGIPVSLMEALASKLHVIATNISGVPELVIHRKTGYLVQPENPKVLAEAILYIMQHPAEADAWASAGRDLVLKEFNVSANVSKLSDMFELVLEDKKWK